MKAIKTGKELLNFYHSSKNSGIDTFGLEDLIDLAIAQAISRGYSKCLSSLEQIGV